MTIRVGFFAGAGMGLAAGVLTGAMLPGGHRSVRAKVGKGLRKMSHAADRAVDTLVSEIA